MPLRRSDLIRGYWSATGKIQKRFNRNPSFALIFYKKGVTDQSTRSRKEICFWTGARPEAELHGNALSRLLVIDCWYKNTWPASLDAAVGGSAAATVRQKCFLILVQRPSTIQGLEWCSKIRRSDQFFSWKTEESKKIEGLFGKRKEAQVFQIQIKQISSKMAKIKSDSPFFLFSAWTPA